MTRRRTPLAALFVLLVIVAGACRPAAQRFAELDGPLADNVVFPDEFGIDVSHLSVDVAPLLKAVSTKRLHSRVDAIRRDRGRRVRRGACRRRLHRHEAPGHGAHGQAQNASNGGATMPNVFADRAGAACPDRLFVVGAHYDSVSAGPGRTTTPAASPGCWRWPGS